MDDFRTSAGLLIRHKGRILLVRQSETGSWSIPKGTPLSGENLLDTAIRETHEETGVKIDKNTVTGPMKVCLSAMPQCKRKLFYWETELQQIPIGGFVPSDTCEIIEASFFDEAQAIRVIQLTQAGILFNASSNRIHPDLLLRLEEAGWIKRARHPYERIDIWKYTALCKESSAWSEATLWCRGLITDPNGIILSRPMKKFFEYDQMPPECRPENGPCEVSEKNDGALGISYFINGAPHIATLGSFTSPAAIEAEVLLHDNKSAKIMRSDRTYLFEIISPITKVVVDYGNTRELRLIEVIDTNTGRIVKDLAHLHFSRIPSQKRSSWKELLHKNEDNKEGLVIRFQDGTRLKIKYPWYKQEYLKRIQLSGPSNIDSYHK